MKKKIRVGILFGGRSAEHEVSLQSAKNVISAINKKKYDIVLIGIDKKGRWHPGDSTHLMLNDDDPRRISLSSSKEELSVMPGDGEELLISRGKSSSIGKIDVVFPVLHGTYGEDGTVQGLLKLLNIPFVGADILGSAACMDKDTAKRLMRDADITTAHFCVYRKGEKLDFNTIKKELGLPFFIKPANLGSSVGISKVKDKNEFIKAASLAFKYDKKIIIEEYIPGREIECAVLGNEDPIASVPGEVIVQHEFYSYEAKYLDENGARLEIPAHIPVKTAKKIQETAIKAVKNLCCEGM
ncbi:D-alanine--D-alanine ligase family protein, partial [Spirochaetota bacterium]